LTNSYRRGNVLDEALLFSLDFPHARARDCYVISSEEGNFKLHSEKKRVCCGNEAKPNLSIAVAPHGGHDDIVVLRNDGIYTILRANQQANSSCITRIKIRFCLGEATISKKWIVNR